MSIWIELHCDYFSPAVDECMHAACESGSGNQPGFFTTKPARSARNLKKEAKKRGWLIKEDKATCPECTKYWKSHPGENPEWDEKYNRIMEK